MLQTPAAASRHHSLLRQHSASGRQGEMDASQQRLYASYAIMYDAHAQANQLLLDCIAVLAAQYGAAADDGGTASRAPPPTAAEATATRYTPLSDREDRRQAVEELLVCFTAMQRALSSSTMPTALAQPEVSAKGRTERDDDEEEEEANLSFEQEVREAYAYLLTCLPTDWQQVVLSSSSSSQRKSSVVRDTVTAHGKQRTNVTTTATTTEEAAAAATRTSHAAAEGGFVSPSPLCAAPPAHDGDGAHPPTHTAVPDRVLTCPADIVQLALLLRRHWALHRNVTVAIPALMDVLALLEEGRTDTTDACCTSGVDTVPGNRPCSLPLSVAMALAVLHLSYAQLTIDGAATLHPSAPASPLYTPAEEHLVASAALPSVASAATTAITTLPLLLWRAYTQTHHAGSTSAEGIRRSGPHTTLQEFSSSLTSLSVAAAAVTPPSYAIARQLTKQLFSWEAHIAAYVNAQLGEHDRAGVRSSVYSTITNNNGDDGDEKDEDNADSDVEFLRATQAELTVLCGACHSAELMWFSLYALLNPHDTHDTEVKRSRSALASVAKRAAKLAALLQTLWDSSATAQLLLPGVLLWCGECRQATGGVKSTLNDVRPTDPLSKQREGEQDQQQMAYWQRGYDLGVHAFGRSHPLVVQLSALLAAQSRKGTVATTTGPTMTTVTVNAAAAAGKAEEDSLLSRPTPHVASPSSPPSHAAAPIPVLRSPLPPAAPQPPLPRLARSPLPAASAPRAATATTTVSHAPPSLLGSHGAAPPPVRSTWSAHQPDPSHVFVTAYSSPRRPPAAAVGGFAGGPSSPLHRTFPLPLTSAGAGGTAPSTSRGGSHRQGPLNSTTSRSARDAEATKQRPPTRLAALRNCHRLAHPADAFGLRSTVADAVFEDDLENMDLLPGQKGKRSGAASGASSRKGKGRGAGGAAAAQRDGTASTAALLLSASVGDGGGETGAGSADGEGSTAAAAASQYGRRRKKRRPDRVLLPPVASAPRPPPSKQIVVRGKAQSEQQQQQQHSVLEPPSGDSDPFAVFSQRSEEPFWSPRGGDHDAALTGSDTAAEGMGAALHNSGSSSNNMDAASVLKKNSHVTHAPHEDSVAPSVEEEDEEDYERETLPERNARLQREVRMYFQGLNERRVRAAATIQRAWRCCKARQTLRERQQMLYRYVYIIQKAAALALEGFILSVWAQRRRRAAQQSRRIADAQRETLERRQLAAAAVLTRAGRRWVQRQCERRRLRAQLNLERDARLQQYEATAVVVQRWWRAIVPQKAYWRRRHREVAEQRRLQAEADRLARAATVIQRRVRGMQARVRVAALRRRAAAAALALRRQRDAAATVLFIVLQEHALRQARQTRETADRQAKEQRSALCIAENWRATLERRRLAVAVQRARQLRTAAALIQRAWRRYSAGRLRRHLRQTRSATLRDRLALELRAWGSVVLLQSAARGAMARLQVAALKAREGLTFMQTVTLLQSVGRGFAARRGCRQAWTELQDRQRIAAAQAEERRNAAATRTQALLRARSSALAVRRALQVCLTERVHVYGSAAAEMRRDAAAAVLQRAVRRHQQRQRATLARAEAAAALCFLHGMAQRVQRGWRCFHARQERRRRAAAVRACALRRQQAEEVLELVWRDQRRELEVLCTLEQHYIAEAEHAARVALYRAWTHKAGKGDEGAMGGAEQQQQQWRKASCGGDALERWAALYVD